MSIKRKIILWTDVEFSEEELRERGFDPNNEDDIYKLCDEYVMDVFFDKDFSLFNLLVEKID
jgi:hypothetical protein